MSEEEAVGVVHLDFRKAFDIIFQSILLERMAAHGLERCTVCWVKNWLDVWVQRVVVNGVNIHLDFAGSPGSHAGFESGTGS